MHNNLLLAQPSDEKLYVEDVFSTYLYTGTGASQTITNGIALGDSNVFSNASTTALPAATNRSWTALTFGNGNYFAVSYQAASPFVGNRFAYSTDGINWTSNTSAPSATWVGAAYGNNLYVAVSQGITGYPATAVYASSLSGTFSTATGFPNITTNNVRWVNGRFIATAQGGTTMAYSLTGTSWSSMTVPSGDWFDVTYGNGKWVCVSQTDASCITSTNGTTWTQAGTSLRAYSIAFGNGIFIATGVNATYTSTDGVNWTTVTSLCPINNSYQIIFDGTYFIVAGSNSSGQTGVAYSTDGSSWVFRPSTTTTFNGSTTGFIVNGNDQYSIISRGTNNYSATISSLIPATIGKGGLVWLKDRTSANPAWIMDTLRGTSSTLQPSSTNGAGTISTAITAFNANGFAIGANGNSNTNNNNYASWTFRKAPKFFDVLTWTGDGVTTRTISHSLGVVPGMIIVKRTDGVSNWLSYNLGNGNYFAGQLNTTNALTNIGTPASLNVTSTDFRPSDLAVNGSGASYVAYLFAHDTTADGVIQCGSFTTDGSGNATVNLGWEPQYVLLKVTSSAGQWIVLDTMRGLSQSPSKFLLCNSAQAEGTDTATYFSPTATGFVAVNGAFPASANVIYMAIRRGPMRVPTDATKVFSANTVGSSSSFNYDSQLYYYDLGLIQSRDAYFGPTWSDRLRGIGAANTSGTVTTNAQSLTSASTAVETTSSYMVQSASGGFTVPSIGSSRIFYRFRRAPGFFDCLCYTGTGAALPVSHNLGVAPELIIVKPRNNNTTFFGNWVVQSSYLTDGFAFPAGHVINLNKTNASSQQGYIYNVGSSSFTVSGSVTSGSGTTYVAYLFASCPGVSKVGSYTGNGSSLNIDCGFTNGARFVLIKRTDSTGDWFTFDTARGIVTANDPHLSLNTTAAEVTTNDSIDPLSSGFTVNQNATTNINVSGGTYIYLAIA